MIQLDNRDHSEFVLPWKNWLDFSDGLSMTNRLISVVPLREAHCFQAILDARPIFFQSASDWSKRIKY